MFPIPLFREHAPFLMENTHGGACYGCLYSVCAK